jgi:head-tail adaptor
MIGSPLSIGTQKDLVTLDQPGPPIPNPDGGYGQTWTALSPPSAFAAIVPATVAVLERLAAGTVVSTASHVITFPYHPEVTTQTRIHEGPRSFTVVGVVDPDNAHVLTRALCVEVVR